MGMRNRTSDIIDNFLTGFVVGGSIALTFVAPNAIIALEKPLNKFIDRRSKKESRRIARYLKQQKLVNISPNDDGSFTVTLTERGKTRAQKAYFERLTIPNRKWDEKWRVLMFDIPEKHKQSRDYISFHLKRIGFRQLQKSVFIYPFPVDDFVAILYELFPEIKRYISYMTVTEIDNHNSLVKLFKHLL